MRSTTARRVRPVRLAVASAAALCIATVGLAVPASAATTTEYVTEDDYSNSGRVFGERWYDLTTGGAFEVDEFEGDSAMRLDLATSTSKVYLYETYPAEDRPTDVEELREGASYTYAGTNVNFQIELLFRPTDPAYGPGTATPCDSANAWGFTDVPSTWCYTVIKWEPLAKPATWTTVDLTADTAVDSTNGIGGWRTSKRIGTWLGTGGFSGSGTFDQYFAQIAEYEVAGTAFGTGSGTPGPVSGWVRDVTFGGVTTLFGQAPAVTTTTALAASAASITEGATVTLTATVTPSAAVGDVEFSAGSTPIGSASVSGGVATLTVTPPVGLTTYSAEFVPGNEDEYSGSTSGTVAVTVTAIPTPQPPVAPPAANTADLLEFIEENDVDVEGDTANFAVDGGAPGATTEFPTGTTVDAQLPWGGDDDFVDAYGYSTPVHLGTFPVVNGVAVLDGLDLSALGAGDHHLVVIGQSSGEVAVVAIVITAAAAPSSPQLATTGSETAAPLALAGVLLAVGILLAARRRRQA